MIRNYKLCKAKNKKNDEFYTQFQDVVAELRHYGGYFCDKIVYCNCDDPAQSAFWKYFHLYFTELGLKKLISTHYDLKARPYKMEYEGGADDNVNVGVVTFLSGNGDFRSPECINALNACDIVVTNPPFSLFREYVKLLMEHEKKFIIIGNINCVTYKEIFPLIKDCRLWLGLNMKGGTRKGNTMFFGVPDAECLVQVPSWWFTNLDHFKRHDKMVLCKRYDAKAYPKYDNYDAINVDRTEDIPFDYAGVMGVPVSFLNKYCPEQFEILGVTESEGKGLSNGLWHADSKVSQPLVGGRRVYKRLFIRRTI